MTYINKSKVRLIDENGVAYGVKEEGNKLVIVTENDTSEAGISKIDVRSDVQEQLLLDILKELKKMNTYLSLMTDTQL
jgi:hypothetical protein